jgi:hypothetical protein
VSPRNPWQTPAFHRRELKRLGRAVSHVYILAAGDSCPACVAHNRRRLTVEAALLTMPIPHPECTERRGCRCCYVADTETLRV